MRPIYLQLFALIISTSAFSQVINIESLRMHTDSVRFVLKDNLRFSFNSNNGVSNYFIGNSLGAQIKSKDLKKIYLFLGDYSILRSEGKSIRNSWYLHFRFNSKLEKIFKSKMVRLEAFAQHQYNEILIINYRNLAGIGLRLKLNTSKHETENKEITKYNKETTVYNKANADRPFKTLNPVVRFYFGLAYMYEEEKSNSFDNKFSNNRASSYLSFDYTFANGSVTILNTIYYQPKFSDFNDYRISEDFQLSIKLTESLDLNGNFSYYMDSVTPQGVKDYASYLSLGLGLTL